MIKYKKINLLIFIVLITIVIIFLYGTSLSCDYRMKIETKTTSYNGICKLGETSWIETQKNKINGSIWNVTAWSFSFKNNVIYIIKKRERLNKIGNVPNNLDIYNTQLDHISILNYEYYDLSEHHIAIFSQFPEEHVFIAEIHGTLSLFSSKNNNRTK